MSAEQPNLFKQVRTRVAKGEMTSETFNSIKHELVTPGLTVYDYVQASVDFGEMAWWNLEDGKRVLRFMDPESQRTSREITQRVLELKEREKQLLQQGVSLEDPRLQKIHTWFEAIQWFTQK